VDDLIHSGADKIMLNNVLFKNPSIVTSIARKYGDQCVVVCMDVKRDSNGKLHLYDYIRKERVAGEPAEWARKLEKLGAGEILVHAVDRDGSKSGFDIEAYNLICGHVNIPVIALGGAGRPDHFMDVFENTDVSAACAGNYFHFTEHSVITTKAYLITKGMDLRLETHADYKNAGITEKNRLLKNSDDMLEHLLYLKIEKEVI
jgi:cyclase